MSSPKGKTQKVSVSVSDVELPTLLPPAVDRPPVSGNPPRSTGGSAEVSKVPTLQAADKNVSLLASDRHAPLPVRARELDRPSTEEVDGEVRGHITQVHSRVPLRPSGTPAATAVRGDDDIQAAPPLKGSLARGRSKSPGIWNPGQLTAHASGSPLIKNVPGPEAPHHLRVSPGEHQMGGVTAIWPPQGTSQDGTVATRLPPLLVSTSGPLPGEGSMPPLPVAFPPGTRTHP